MSITLRILLVAFSLLFLTVIVRLVAGSRLQLKYSLLWILFGLVLLVCAMFPDLVGILSHAAGVEMPANFVFLIWLALLTFISVSLTIIVSWQAHDIRSLIQRVALLEKQVWEQEQRDGLPSE